MVDIRFGELRIDTVSGSSGIYAGSNKLHKRKHVSKGNEAFGAVSGRNTIMDVRTLLRDRDVLDMAADGKLDGQ